MGFARPRWRSARSAQPLRRRRLPGPDTVTLPAGVYTLTLAPPANPPRAPQIWIEGELTLSGHDASDTIIDGHAFVWGGISGELGTAVQISDVTIQNGVEDGAIEVSAASLLLERSVLRQSRFGLLVSGNFASGRATVIDSVIEGNTADAGPDAAGIWCLDCADPALDCRGELTLLNSTVRDNVGGDRVAGIHLADCDATIRNSTISGNGGDPGGGVDAVGGAVPAATLLIENTTITDNTSDGAFPGVGLWIGTPNGNPLTTLVAEVRNTLIANNGWDCGPTFGDFPSAGYNLDSDGSCGLTAPGDLSDVDPVLGSLGDNGGLTPTHALLHGSPAIDAGDDATCAATDQRGVARPQGNACDIGAFEARVFIVDSTNDAKDALAGDGVCATAVAECTLRAAIEEANALPGPDTVTLPAGVYTLTLAPPANPPRAPQIWIEGELTLSGHDASDTIIDGHAFVWGGISGELGTAVQISDVTIQNGVEDGAIEVSAASLLLERSVLRQSRFGLLVSGKLASGRATVIDSVIEGNTADAGPDAAGIWCLDCADPALDCRADFALLNSTVRDNVGGDRVAGIHLADCDATIRNSTISGNGGTREGVWTRWAVRFRRLPF